MKRFIVLLVLLLCALSAVAQSRLIMKKQDAQSGRRTLATSEILVRNGMSDRHPLKVGVVAVQAPDWKYSLQVAVSETVSRAVPFSGVMLIRTKSGQTYELVNTLKEVDSRDFVGKWIEGTAIKTYENRASYAVTREQLDDIANGVVKIRMQLSDGAFDTEYKKEKLGEAVKAHLVVIDAEISMGGDLRQGF